MVQVGFLPSCRVWLIIIVLVMYVIIFIIADRMPRTRKVVLLAHGKHLADISWRRTSAVRGHQLQDNLSS